MCKIIDELLEVVRCSVYRFNVGLDRGYKKRKLRELRKVLCEIYCKLFSFV